MSNLLRHSKLFFKRNASTILTCMGGAGVITTSVMAVKATPKALLYLEKAKEEKDDRELTRMEIVKAAGPVYIPTILVGVGTLACIFGANILSKRQQAALMSAYALLDNSHKEYKNKVKELYGEETDDEVTTEIAKDKHKDDSGVVVEDDKTLFYDEFSGRFFASTHEKVLIAEYELNRLLTSEGAAFLNDFYKLVGLPETEYGHYVGWSSFEIMEMTWTPWLNFDHVDMEMEDGSKCCKVVMRVEPYYDFLDY